MSKGRLIIEMGMGTDLHGGDYTKAARRAMDDALHHSSLAILGAMEIDPADIEIRVTIGAANPDAVDADALAAIPPKGQVSVAVVEGGLDVTNPDTGDRAVTASAAIEVFLPQQTGWVLTP